MKRLFQFMAIAMAGLVAAQPALAGLLCAAPVSACPVAMTDMGPGCPMAGRMAADNCPLTAYLRAMPQSLASVASPARPKVESPAGAQSSTFVLPTVVGSRLASGAAAAEASSPPLYLLNRVFRI